jgi:hypothetical protein
MVLTGTYVCSRVLHFWIHQRTLGYILLPLIKSEDYQHENEYRLVYIASREEPALKKYIKQTWESGIYLETEKVLFERFPKFKDDYPAEEYTEVYIGPKADKITCVKCCDSFGHKYPGVKIKQSAIERR